MAYYLERFGSITLPTAMSRESSAPAVADDRIVATVTGAFDGDGSGRNQQRFPHTLTYQAIVAAASLAAQRTALDALRAAVGTRAYLYRRADDNGVVHRAMCRLVAMPHDREYEHQGYLPVRLEFRQLEAWQGAATSWTLDDGELLDDGLDLDASTYFATLSASPASQAVTNGGNLPVRTVTVTINAGSGIVVNPIITAPNIDLRWAGSIPAGQSLVIDGGALSVLLIGADAYSGLYFGGTHTGERWIELAPGASVVTLTIGGTLTGASWSIDFREVWA